MRSDARPPVVSRQFLLCFGANFLQNLAFTLYLHLSGFLHELGADEVGALVEKLLGQVQKALVELPAYSNARRLVARAEALEQVERIKPA